MAQTREGAIKVFCGRYGITPEFYHSQLEKGLKWCSGCKQWIDRKLFNKETRAYDGLCSKCVSCTRVKVKVDRHKIPSAFKGHHHTEESKKKLSMAHLGKTSKLKGIPRTLEDRIKISESVKPKMENHKGENNPNWKGGKSSKIVKLKASFDYKVWKEQVNERDNYTCQICGCNIKEIIETHHIKRFRDYPELRFDVNNGITICKFCHQLEHTKKQYKRENIEKRRKEFYENYKNARI